MMKSQDIKIERVVMSGRGPRFTYKLVYNNSIMFQTSSNSYTAWTRKKDAKAIIEAIDNYGLCYVESKLNQKAFL